MSDIVSRTERGWAGHFCASGGCQFRRNTLLEKGGRGIVVSTVGGYYPRGGDRVEQIGFQRHYETMAFRADMDDDIYRDADVSCEVPISTRVGLLMTPDNESTIHNIANDMHELAVSEIANDFDAKWRLGRSWRDEAGDDNA